MKLIIVQRSKTATYRRLVETFADDPNVKVIFERRLNPERDGKSAVQERRRLKKRFDGRDYVVVHVAIEKVKT